MPRSCSVCANPRASEISKDLAAGASIRAAAFRFGVTPAAAHRHLNRCLKVKRRVEQGVTSAKTARRDSSTPNGADSSRFAPQAAGDRCDHCGQLTGEGEGVGQPSRLVSVKRVPVSPRLSSARRRERATYQRTDSQWLRYKPKPRCWPSIAGRRCRRPHRPRVQVTETRWRLTIVNFGSRWIPLWSGRIVDERYCGEKV
jgi:hypothetical protein